MWQIDGETNRIYLLGSVHLLREQDHPIPDAIYTAYDEVDLLVMELDMDDIDPIATQTMINDLGMIKGGESLSDLMGSRPVRRSGTDCRTNKHPAGHANKNGTLARSH